LRVAAGRHINLARPWLALDTSVPEPRTLFVDLVGL